MSFLQMTNQFHFDVQNMGFVLNTELLIILSSIIFVFSLGWESIDP